MACHQASAGAGGKMHEDASEESRFSPNAAAKKSLTDRVEKE
jgi:hypothetical protein